MNNEIFDELIYWIRERRKINECINYNTQDNIFKKYHFCNVSRDDDKFTILFKDKIIENASRQDIIFNIFLHRNISYYKTTNKIGYKNEFNESKFKELYNNLKKKNGIFFTNSFIRCFSIDKFITALRYIFDNGENIYNELVKNKSLRHYFNTFRKLPMVGDFMAWQMTCDLLYLQEFEMEYHEMDFVKLGPGAKAGLKLLETNKVFDLLDKINTELIINEECLISIIDLEHCLCELGKYHKVKNNLGKCKLRRKCT